MRILRNNQLAKFDYSLCDSVRPEHQNIVPEFVTPPDAIVMQVYAQVKLKGSRKPLAFRLFVLLKTEGKHWEEK